MTCASIDSRPERSRRPSSRSTSVRASFGSSSLLSFSRSSSISLAWSSSPSSFWMAFICSRRNISRCRSPSSSCTCDLISSCASSSEIWRCTCTSTRRRRSSTDERLEQPLLLRHRQLDVAGDEVGELAGLRHGIEHLVHHFLGKPAALAELGGALADLLVERLERGILVVERRHLLDVHHDRGEVSLALRELERRGPLLALQQELHAAQARAAPGRSGR